MDGFFYFVPKRHKIKGVVLPRSQKVYFIYQNVCHHFLSESIRSFWYVGHEIEKKN